MASIVRCILAWSSLVTLAGCGAGTDPHGRQALAGTVTYQGQALDGGSIRFVSTEPNGPSAGAVIRAGKYDIPRAQGLPPGSYRVMISALESAPTPPGAPGEVPVVPAAERIPAEYNMRSTLSIDVQAGRETPFDFMLK